MPGHETMLRSHGFCKGSFRAAVYHDQIEPAVDGVRWYKGPHHQRMWDADLFTEQEIKDFVINGKKKVWHVGDKRLEEIVAYFENQN